MAAPYRTTLFVTGALTGADGHARSGVSPLGCREEPRKAADAGVLISGPHASWFTGSELVVDNCQLTGPPVSAAEGLICTTMKASVSR